MSKSRARASSSPAGMRVPNPREVFIEVEVRAARPRAEDFLREAGGRRRRSVLRLSATEPEFSLGNPEFLLQNPTRFCPTDADSASSGHLKEASGSAVSADSNAYSAAPIG